MAAPTTWASKNIGTERVNAGEGVGEHSGNGDSWVGEAGGASEPVASGDVGADRPADQLWPSSAAQRSDQQYQAGGSDHLGQPDALAGAL